MQALSGGHIRCCRPAMSALLQKVKAVFIKGSQVKWATHVSQSPVSEICALKKNNFSFLSEFWQTTCVLNVKLDSYHGKGLLKPHFCKGNMYMHRLWGESGLEQHLEDSMDLGAWYQVNVSLPLLVFDLLPVHVMIFFFFFFFLYSFSCRKFKKILYFDIVYGIPTTDELSTSFMFMSYIK